MSTVPEPAAVTIARAHVEAWSNHDFDTARKGLAPDVHVTASTTMTGAPPTDVTGVDDYMIGLTQFAQAVVPGSARILESVGDERNALILVAVEADFGDTKTTLPAARLYLLDENNKIKSEQVVFYISRG
jgi:SnoaL-like protein